jgi:8-oxo-dGTP pyrophosphatase MutT (NUDIX family)
MEERPIRRAASAICVRTGADGPEVLVVVRSETSRFLPGYVAFPGGAVEPGDDERAGRWFGDPSESSRAAAVREVIEEVGLALTSGGLVAVDADDTFARVHASPPSVDGLREMAHWIAPPVVPVRFDARYFAVAAEGAPDPVPDGVEATEAGWVAPALLHDQWAAGERKLYWPTYWTLQHLLRCTTAEEALELRFETREPTQDEIVSLPRSVMEQV